MSLLLLQIYDHFLHVMYDIYNIGYGDNHPVSDVGKLFCSFFVLAGVCVFSFSVSRLMDLYADFAQLKTRGRVLYRTWDIKSLKALDDDGDGKISWGEYLEQTLVDSGNIQQGVIDEFKERYDRQVTKMNNKMASSKKNLSEKTNN